MDKAVPKPAAFSTHLGRFCGLAGRIAVIENIDLDVTIQTNFLCISTVSLPLAVQFTASGITVESQITVSELECIWEVQ